MDATVATGAAAMMAIRVLLDHEVKEEDIILVSLLMAESGDYTVCEISFKLILSFGNLAFQISSYKPNLLSLTETTLQRNPFQPFTKNFILSNIRANL